MRLMTRACVLLAPGFEEIEAVTIIDVLRRAEIDTRAVGVEGKAVEGSHGIALRADVSLDELATEPWDLVVLPGGMPGAKHLRDSPAVQRLLRAQHASGRRLAAICAAPIALSAAEVLTGRRATSYPSFAEQLRCGEYREEAVVVDGPIITSRGPATALEFALRLVRELCGAEREATLRKAMLAAPSS
jgi:4-methyl-5(b-hydroxyethyl)-thiazole monophosphate biosynthesis